MKSAQRYFIKMYYLADHYLGSQRQKEENTIEGILIKALIDKSYIENESKSGFEAASRTDRFVSARGSVFSFITQKSFYPEELNSALPNDIGVWAVARVPIDYKPRRNAICRHYKYIFEYPISYLIKKSEFEIDLIKQGCNLLKGSHDFVNFAKKDKDKNTVRDLEDIKLSIINDFLILDFYSQSFLRQQIRRIIRKLVELGTKKITFDEFKALFDPMKSFSYKPYSPNGLVLWDIIYPKEVNFFENIKGKERMCNFFEQKYYYSLFRTNFFNILKDEKD